MSNRTPGRNWVKTYLDHWDELSKNQEFDLHLRVHFLALSRATASNHVHFEHGEIRRTLEVVNKRTGETGPPARDKVSKAVNRAVSLGLLAPGSNAACLVLPTGHEYGIGNPTKVCDRHGGCLAKATSSPSVALGRQQGCLAKATPNAVTCDDAPSLLDVSHGGAEVEVESSGVKDQEVPSGTSSQVSTGEEMSALSGTHRQKVKKISEISGVEEILFSGEEDEGLTAQPGEESIGEENKGLSAQSGLLLDVGDWDDPLPSPSAGEEAPEGASPEPSGEEAKPESSAAVEPPRLHCSGCDESGHSYWACPRVDTAGAEAVEVDEAQEEPTGRMIGSGYGGGRRLATLPPAAAEPPRYRTRYRAS